MALIDKASLLMVPSTYEAGTLYNVLPSGNRAPDNKGGAGYDQTRADFTFDRGSNAAATRVNSDGLIEKYRENLLLQSNQFDTTWSISGSTTLSSGQSGYDGSNNAWLLSKSDGQYRRIYQSVAISGVCTLSVYAKANTLNQITLRDGSTNALVRYDLSDGSLVGTAGSPITYSIVSVGNGWWRCSLTMSSSVQPSIYVEWSQSAAGSIYIQNAQLESGLVATDVLTSGATTAKAGVLIDLPRINYDANGENGALLLEPQRANLAALSEYIEGWSHKPNTTTTSNYTTSPEGLKNATRLQFTANGYLYNSNAPAQVNGAQHTLSCYAKRNDSGTQSFGFFTNGSGSVDSTMSLTSEWQRFTYTYTATNASQLGLAGLSGADVSVFGFQVEASASYATSYIPTYGTSVTRNADYATKTGVSDLIGQTEGSAYLEIKEFIPQPPGNIGAILSLHGGSSTNRIGIIHLPNTTEIQVYVITGGAAQALYNFTPSSGINKIAIGYANNDIAIAVNGAIAYTDTNATIPATSAIGLNTYGFTNIHANDSIKQVLLFKERLSNAELATLTTI